MSDALFPVLPGLTFDMKCNSRFNTVVHEPVAGREVRARFSGYPLWLFVLQYDFLDDTPEGDADLETLHGFICQRGGRYDSFLYDHDNANTVTDSTIGIGDGSKTDFQLVRHWGGFTEPVENPKSDVAVTVDEVAIDAANYGVGTTGLVSFKTTPVDYTPADGAVIRWSGGYYFRCRFDSDDTDFTEFARRLYTHQDFQFRGSPVNKV